VLPVFVVTPSPKSAQSRDVHLGWVVNWDDENEMFLVTFTDDAPAGTGSTAAANLFPLFDDDDQRRRREVSARPNQQRFRFDVLARYGAACAVCDITAREVLDTSTSPKRRRGALIMLRMAWSCAQLTTARSTAASFASNPTHTRYASVFGRLSAYTLVHRAPEGAPPRGCPGMALESVGSTLKQGG
jgi:hypothetical protein